MSSQVNVLKRFFESKSIHVSTYWLECCLEWFKENNRTYTETFMCNEVLRQWLEADLRDIEIPSLPNAICQHKKHEITGNYAVQILYVKDISKSAYSQLKTIRDMYKLTRAEFDKDSDTSGTGKCTLYLYMTDGVQNICGFEYQPISCLNTNIKPGTKILLVGPLVIRNGEFLLKECNVRILGGQVDELLICNAYENVLARELKMPENPTPGQLQQDNRDNIEIHNNVNNTLLNVNIPQNPLTYSNNTQNNDYHMSIDDDDDLFNDINLSEHFDNPQEDELFQDSIDINISELEDYEMHNHNTNTTTVSNTNNYGTGNKMEVNQLKLIEMPVNNDIEPYIYIKYLLDSSDNILNKTFKVKARFDRVVQKLSVNKTKGWTMEFEITDGTGTITVDFLSSVIEKLMDISPSEALAENLKVKNKLSESHKKVTEALQKCKIKLETFEYIMHLQFKQIEKPTIICLETVTKEHFNQLHKRIENTKVKLLY